MSAFYKVSLSSGSPVATLRPAQAKSAYKALGGDLNLTKTQDAYTDDARFTVDWRQGVSRADVSRAAPARAPFPHPGQPFARSHHRHAASLFHFAG